MRIFAAGDLHGDADLAKKLAEKAQKETVDLVLINGDITQQDQNWEYIIGPFKNKNLKVVFNHGNHESKATADFLTELYQIKNLHGRGLNYKGFGFFGAGGANVGLEKLSEEEFFSVLSYGSEKVNYLDKKIMVTHVHPSGTKIENFSSFFPGSSGVRKAVESLKPDLLICSHVHEAEGIEEKIGRTKVINVGRQGRIIDL
ncbi:MAG: metallophosphoesterase family protein [Nanoarchaeota archaeon]